MVYFTVVQMSYLTVFDNSEDLVTMQVDDEVAFNTVIIV